MDKTYTVRIRYRELVEGAHREFTHDVEMAASNSEEARTQAVFYFNELARNSWVCWPREILDVLAVPNENDVDH